MADNKIQMPSSGGGLVRYFDDFKGKIRISPLSVMIFVGVEIVVEVLLYKGIF